MKYHFGGRRHSVLPTRYGIDDIDMSDEKSDYKNQRQEGGRRKIAVSGEKTGIGGKKGTTRINGEVGNNGNWR